MPGADDDLRLRVADLENAVAALRDDVARLAAARAPAAAPPPSPPPPHSARAEPPRATPDSAPRKPLGAAQPAAAAPSIDPPSFENLVGRYGVLALATVLTLAAVGTFVSWAAAHGMLGPTTRVVLGLLLAAALAVAGLRLRAREPSFGSSLIALALAVVQVCAWAAGPGLHLVPEPAAFALAVVASAALAAFAHVENEEPLWCVGIGGAAIAPFVTSSQSGSMVLLASYGAVVGIAAAAGIANTAWRYAQDTVAGVAVLYALALQLPTPMPPHWGPLLAVALPIAIALGGIMPVTAAELVRPRLRAQGLVAGLAAAWASLDVTPLSDGWTRAYFGAAALVWLVMADLTSDAPAAGTRTGTARDVEPFGLAWIDGAIVPLLFVVAAAMPWTGAPWWRVWVLAASSLALVTALWRRAPGGSRDALALAAAVAALTAVAIAPWVRDIAHPIAYAVLAAAFVVLLPQRPTYSWVVAIAAALAAGGANTWILMYERGAFAYAPFRTGESLAALAILGACWWTSRESGRIAGALGDARPAGATGDVPAPNTVRRWAVAAPWIWAFIWAHRELAGAWSPSLATFALVTLEAATAVALVGFGRAMDERLMRQTGLALAVVAALRALLAVEGVASVSLRIASYLVASAFLLGIAYWYRRRGRDASPVVERADT